MTSNEQDTIIGIIDDRIWNISDIIIRLSSEGYIPNKNKLNRLALFSLLKRCFKNINIFDEDREAKLINFYIKLMQT